MHEAEMNSLSDINNPHPDNKEKYCQHSHTHIHICYVLLLSRGN
jgi:hypothetical protein